jgi:hypothetical protein
MPSSLPDKYRATAVRCFCRGADRKIKRLGRLAACFTDGRDAERIVYEVDQLISQRTCGLTLRHEDLNGHERQCGDRADASTERQARIE